MAERTQKWDILKFFLMFTVVLGHFLDYHAAESEVIRSAFLFIYSFHMPLFIFVAGLFSKRMVNERRWEKMLGYLVLYFFTKICVFLYELIFKQETEFRLFGETGLAWYMFAMFAFSVITVGASRYKPQYVFTVSLLLSLFAGYDSEINHTLVLSRIIVFYPFYYAGYCLDPKKIEKFSHGILKKLAALVVIGAIAAVAFSIPSVYCVRPMFTGQHPYNTLGAGESFGFLIRLACYAVSALGCISLVVLTPDRIHPRFIAKCGQYTLPVYIFHYIIKMLLYNTFVLKEFFDEPNSWLLVPISLAITILLGNKYLNKVVAAVSSLPQIARKNNKTTEEEHQKCPSETTV